MELIYTFLNLTIVVILFVLGYIKFNVLDIFKSYLDNPELKVKGKFSVGLEDKHKKKEYKDDDDDKKLLRKSDDKEIFMMGCKKHGYTYLVKDGKMKRIVDANNTTAVDGIDMIYTQNCENERPHFEYDEINKDQCISELKKEGIDCKIYK